MKFIFSSVFGGENIINRIGEIKTNTYGTKMKIIAYRKCDDIDVEFLAW